MTYTISGLQPVQTGGKWEHGNSWFLFDESGTFSVDKDIKARVYLVGGGCKGEDGGYVPSTETRFGGNGGDGGYISPELKITIPKNADCVVNIASANDQSGTSLSISGNVFKCDIEGSIKRKGGYGGFYRTSGNQSPPKRGEDGILTPYGYVGSSGGGGGLDGGTGAGKPATNYGCGGCGGARGSGKGSEGQKGCIIICIISDVEIPDTPNLTYNGLEQYPFGENGIKGVKITGDLSATAAGKYTSYLNLESDDLCWSDGTQREIKIEWEINPITVSLPSVSQTIFEVIPTGTGGVQTITLPIAGIDANLMTVLNTGTYPGEYTATVKLKDPTSCMWKNEDGGETFADDITFDWRITRKVVKFDKPVLNKMGHTYNGKKQSNSLKNWYSKYQGTDCMYLKMDGKMLSSNSFSAMEAGKYSIFVGFKSQPIYDYQWNDDTTNPV